MPAETVVVVLHAAATVAAAAAARLVTRLVDAQAARGSASVALTGGGIGIATLRAVAASPARDAVDWQALDVWWGDERFLPTGDPERNETQAREALLDLVGLDSERVHAMPASDGPDGDDVDAAAVRHAAEIEEAARRADAEGRSLFDVVLLGVGPDAHVASLFPEHPALHDERPVVPVRGAPKPPPLRISLSFPTLADADEVWLLATGEAKRDAVELALSGAGRMQAPAAEVGGRSRTLWLLDREAAGPRARGLGRLASP
ncbi:MAG: 6-phosphogluconolactonase [Actinomycetes bacterium]